jgi:DNA repair exonuclease SbcCD ATPase subunit
MSSVPPERAAAAGCAADPIILTLSEISRFHAENLRLTDRAHSLAAHLKHLTADNHALGDAIANLDRAIDRHDRDVAALTPVLPRLRQEIRRTQAENTRLRRLLLGNPALAHSARSLQRLQSETAGFLIEAQTIKTAENPAFLNVRALIHDKVQVLTESQADLRRQLFALQTALEAGMPVSERKQRLRGLAKEIDPSAIAASERLLDGIELFGALPPADSAEPSVESEHSIDLEAERLAALAAARLTQALLDEEGIERERGEQEALLELARLERERREMEERDRAAAERAARRRRRHKLVIEQFPVREPELPALEKEQPFSDDEAARDRLSWRREEGRMRENEEILAKLREEESARLAERRALLARIAAVSEAPLLINTMPDSTVIILEAITQENILEKIHPVIKGRFATLLPPPNFGDSSGQTEVSSQNIERYRELWRVRIEERQRREDLKEKLTDLMKRMEEIQQQIEQNQQEIEERDSQETLLKARIDAVRAQHAARSGFNIKHPSKSKKSAGIREEVRQRQTALDTLNERHKSLEDKLVELQKIKDMLTDDIHDMNHRDRPEVRNLHGRITESQVKSGQSTARLRVVRQQVANQRKELKMAQSWQASQPLRDLRLARFKLERRQLKWRSFLKNSKENVESFSAVNAERRQALSEQLQRAESEHIDAVERLDELDAYSTLLATLITEQLANWKTTDSSYGE